MLKLYKITNEEKLYWETWDNDDGSHTVHWGELGTEGESKTIKSSFLKSAEDKIQKTIDSYVANGYTEIDTENQHILMIEYAVDGMGTGEDVDKRHQLEDRMNNTLGWTGLGACDGGSIGSGTMEVCNFVVDFETAKKVIEKDLKDTEFSDYTRIYDEGA